MPDHQVPATDRGELSTDRSLRRPAGRYSSSVKLDRPSLSGRDEGEVCRITSLPGFDTQRMLSKNTARRGDEGKAIGCVPPTALLFVALWQRLRSILIVERNRNSLAVN